MVARVHVAAMCHPAPAEVSASLALCVPRTSVLPASTTADTRTADSCDGGSAAEYDDMVTQS